MTQVDICCTTLSVLQNGKESIPIAFIYYRNSFIKYLNIINFKMYKGVSTACMINVCQCFYPHKNHFVVHTDHLKYVSLK